MPVFDKQFYSVIVPENIETMTSLGISLHASSPMKRKLIYTIVDGNENEKFSLDFNTGSFNIYYTIESLFLSNNLIVLFLFHRIIFWTFADMKVQIISTIHVSIIDIVF